MSTPPPPAEPLNLDAVDVLLGVLTAPMLLFALMFLTSRQADDLRDRRWRRRLLLACLATQVVVVAIVVAVVLA